MYIYKDLPVIARKTINKGDICINNETFEVLNFDDKFIYLGTIRPNEEGEETPHFIDIKVEDFMKLFSLNYCSTTHKAQGETITENFTIYDWKKMSEKCKYTAMSRAKNPQQISFGNIGDIKKEEKEFIKNIENKIKGHLKYDEEKGLKSDISVDKVLKLWEKQNGECLICNCNMKTINYKANDEEQFSIDRVDSRLGHTDNNIQLLCLNCNRSKKNRF
jgi:hypothetical protein